jgi:hypothetical protein
MHSSVDYYSVCVCVCTKKKSKKIECSYNTIWISYLQANTQIHKMSGEVIHSLNILWNMEHFF